MEMALAGLGAAGRYLLSRPWGTRGAGRRNPGRLAELTARWARGRAAGPGF